MVTEPSSSSGTSTNVLSAAYCGSSAMSDTSLTVATAACASPNAVTTSSASRSAIQTATAASSSSACSTRPAPVANQGSAMKSGLPTRVMTRSAIGWALVEIASHRPSRVR